MPAKLQGHPAASEVQLDNIEPCQCQNNLPLEAVKASDLMKSMPHTCKMKSSHIPTSATLAESSQRSPMNTSSCRSLDLLSMLDESRKPTNDNMTW